MINKYDPIPSQLSDYSDQKIPPTTKKTIEDKVEHVSQQAISLAAERIINHTTESPDKNQRLAQKLEIIAKTYDLKPLQRYNLISLIERYAKHIERILELIELAEPQICVIYVEILKRWKPVDANKIDKSINIITAHTQKQLESDLIFFNKYGYYKLFQNEIEHHLDMFFFFPDYYDDFLMRIRQNQNAIGLLAAARIKIYNEYVRAYKASIYKNGEELLLSFIKKNYAKLLKLADENNEEKNSTLFRWIGDHPSSWPQILAMDLNDLLETSSIYCQFKENHPDLEPPKLENFIQGWNKNPNELNQLLALFGVLNQSPGRIFNDWAKTPDENTICNKLLSFSKTSSLHNQEMARFIDVINNASIKIPEKEFSAMLTKQKINYLNTLCGWINEGEAAIAIKVCKIYSSQHQQKRRIGLSAIKQNAEIAKIILLYSTADIDNLEGNLPKKTRLLTAEEKFLLTTNMFPAICGFDGQKAVRTWMCSHLKLHKPTGELPLGKLFFMMPLEQRQQTLHMCFLIKNKKDRSHLFQIIASCPSPHFVNLLLTNSDNKLIQFILEQIPNPRDLPRIVEVFTHLSNGTCLPKTRPVKLFLGSSTKVLHQLMAEKPELKTIIEHVLADTSKLAKRIRISIADWYRYRYSDNLVAFFNHYPLESRKMASGDIKPEQKQLWREALVRLECGRMGHIKDVMHAFSIDKNSLVYRAIEACKAFENPKMLKQLLQCNETDGETLQILSTLIAAPEDPWNQFLLRIKTMEQNTSCKAYLEASPESAYVLKGLVRSRRPHLATIYAKTKSLNDTAFHLGISRKSTPKANISPIKSAWNNSVKLTKSAKNNRRTSLEAYENFRENDESVEQYKEVVLALSMAKGMIFDGLLTQERLEEVLCAIPMPIVGSDHHKYLTTTLKHLQNSIDLCDKIVALGHHFQLSQVGILIINGLLGRSADHPIALQEIKLTLLSALLCRPRQGSGIGSCFATAEMIRLPCTSEGLHQLLDLYKQILQTGAIVLYNNETREQNKLHVAPRYLELDLGLSLSHPLVKALEYAMAAGGLNLDHSRVTMAKNIIFKQGGFVEFVIKQIYNNHEEKHPGQLPFTIEHFLNDLKNTFNKTAIELFNPKIKINNKCFSGWELLLKEGLQTISNIKEYKLLFKQVITETLAQYYENHPFGTIGYSLTHATEKALVSYFEPEHPSSKAFVDHLKNELSIKSDTDLWQREGGGSTAKILAGFHNLEKYPSFMFHVNSVEEAFHYLLKYCEDLPTGTKKAAHNNNFYLPLSIPSHSINLTTNSLMKMLEEKGSSKKVLQTTQKECTQLCNKKITKKLLRKLSNKLLYSLDKKFDSQQINKFQESLIQLTLEDLTLKRFARICLKEISIASGDKLIPFREVIRIIDHAIYHSLESNDSLPLYIFADANWTGLEHSDVLLAFGWSFASNKMEVFVTNHSKSEINLLHWNVVDERGWELYAPPLL